MNGFQPEWFTGSPIPSSLTKAAFEEDEAQTDEDSDSVWSDDSDDSEEDDNDNIINM